MSRTARTHPLDADLLDFVEGVTDDATSRSISAHLDTCVLCRAKRDRLVATTPPEDTAAPVTTKVPTFDLVEVEDARSGVFRPGDLWLTDAVESTMVLVRSVPDVGADVVVVVPVTFDSDSVDSTAFVVEPPVSPLPVPVVVYDELVVSLPASALWRRVIPTNLTVDLLAIGDGDPGVRRGSSLEGPGDPRLALHQELLDRLIALDTYPTPRQGAVGVGDGEDDRIAHFHSRLLESRGTGCEVREVTVLPVPAPAAGWAGVAIIDESTLRVVVIDTPAGLNDNQDFVAARTVVARWAASALVVCNRFSDRVDLYEPPALFAAFAMPDGERTSAPLFESLELPDAVIKFLDRQSIVPPRLGDGAGRVRRVDAREVLAARVTEAVRITAGRAPRLGAEKRAGYAQLAAVEEVLRDVIAQAFEPEFDPQAVGDVIGQDGA